MVVKKCWQCRRHKQRCNRTLPWPQKCNRCEKLGHDCSDDVLPTAPVTTHRNAIQRSDSSSNTGHPAMHKRTPSPFEIISRDPSGASSQQNSITGRSLHNSDSNHYHGHQTYDSRSPTPRVSNFSNHETTLTIRSQSPITARSSDSDNGPDSYVLVPSLVEALSRAIRGQDAEEVERLTAEGANVNSISLDPCLESALHAAFQSVDCTCSNEVSLEVTACSRWWKRLDFHKVEKIVTTLLIAGADIHVKDKSGNTLLHRILLHSRFVLGSARSCQQLVGIVKRLEQHGIGSDLITQNISKATPLHYGNIPYDVLDVFVPKRNRLIEIATNIQDHEQNTPLHFLQGDINTFRLLFGLLENPKIRNSKGDTPLTCLLCVENEKEHDYSKGLRWDSLPKGLTWDSIPQGLRWDSLTRVSRIEKMLSIVHKQRPLQDLINERYWEDRSTVLHYFFWQPSPLTGCMSALLRAEYGADVNAKSCRGQTPLHRAVINAMAKLVPLRELAQGLPLGEDLEMCWVLIINGEVDVNIQDQDGNTPLILIMKYLTACLLKMDYRGTLGLSIIASHAAGYLTRWLLNNKADPTLEDGCGQSARTLVKATWDRLQRSSIFKSSSYDEQLDSGNIISQRTSEQFYGGGFNEASQEGVQVFDYEFPLKQANYRMYLANLKSLHLDKTIKFLEEEIFFIVQLILDESVSARSGNKRKHQNSATSRDSDEFSPPCKIFVSGESRTVARSDK